MEAGPLLTPNTNILIDRNHVPATMRCDRLQALQLGLSGLVVVRFSKVSCRANHPLPPGVHPLGLLLYPNQVSVAVRSRGNRAPTEGCAGSRIRTGFRYQTLPLPSGVHPLGACSRTEIKFW